MAKRLTQTQAHIIRDLAELGYGVADIEQLMTPHWEHHAITNNQIKNVIRWCIKKGLAGSFQLKMSYTDIGDTGWDRAEDDYNKIVAKRTQ